MEFFLVVDVHVRANVLLRFRFRCDVATTSRGTGYIKSVVIDDVTYNDVIRRLHAPPACDV